MHSAVTSRSKASGSAPGRLCSDASFLVLQGEGESTAAVDPKSFGRPRLSSIGQVYAGLSDEEVEVGLLAPQAGPALHLTHIHL